MERKDDVSVLYEKSNLIGKITQCLYLLNIISSVLLIFADNAFKKFLILLLIADVICFVVFEVLDTGIFWYNAESARRKNNLQDAFGYRLSELETKGYYNNNLQPSLLKYAMNTFESNFFSKFIAEKMLAMSICKSFVPLLLLFLVKGYLLPNDDLLLLITQTIFSAAVIEDTIFLFLYWIRLKKLYDEAYTQIVTVGISNKAQEIWLLSYVIEYESVKAYYKIRLSSKLFTTYNDTLSAQWQKIIKDSSNTM